MLCFSQETIAVVQNLGLTEGQLKDTREIIEAIEQYVDGHVNETVEWRILRRRVQQQGETFDDFLIALRELVKTCKFCLEDCVKKNICDQIIEGLNDGDTVEDLLQIANLTLTTTITKCHSREAARRHRSNMSVQVAALRRPYQTSHQATPMTMETCPGCGARTHRGGRRQRPAYNQVCSHATRLDNLQEYAEKDRSNQGMTPQTQCGSRQPTLFEFSHNLIT